VLLLGILVGRSELLGHLRGLWQRMGPALALGESGPRTDVPLLALDINFQNYSLLLEQREQALAAGAVFPTEADYVPADIRLEGEETPVRLRVAAGDISALRNEEKWRLELVTRDDAQLAGLEHFYLLDVAANNGVAEWAFLRHLQREGILTPRYEFVRLLLNGTDHGIYALQQGLEPALLRETEPLAGAVVAFDTTRLWQTAALYEGDLEAALADPVLNLNPHDSRFFEVKVRDEMLDPAEPATGQAVALLRGLQQGELTAAQVFDLEQYARFLALVDLWGATGATRLSNLAFYYQPQQERLQPLVTNGNPLQPGARLSPAATFHDNELQAAYVQALGEVGAPAYLDDLRGWLEPELSALQAALPADVRQPDLWQQLAERQVLVNRSLQPPRPVLAYVSSPSLAMSDTIGVEVANLLNLPVEVLGFDIGGATFLEADAEWLAGGSESSLVLPAFDPGDAAPRFARFYLPLAQIVAQDDELPFTAEPEILVATRVLGSDTIQLTPARSLRHSALGEPARAGEEAAEE
jgi:hypothetical protein